MNRSGNPVFKKAREASYDNSYEYKNASYLGVGAKTLFYLLITVVGAILGLYLVARYPDAYLTCLIISVFLGFISSWIAMSRPNLSLVFGSLYCLMEGLLLGTVSVLFEAIIPGIIITVIVATIAVVFASAVLFMTGLIKVTNKFYKFLIMAAVGFILSIIAIWILQLCGVLDSSSFGLAIGISVVSIVIASLFLMSDMEQARQLVSEQGPKQMEWMVAFGISYTILWLYIEILRLAFILLRNVRN